MQSRNFFEKKFKKSIDKNNIGIYNNIDICINANINI